MNPFKYGQVVFDKDFCPRPQLEKKFIDYISSGQNVLLEGERRIGKTSLIFEIMRKMKKFLLLYIDIMEIKNADDFCRMKRHWSSLPVSRCVVLSGLPALEASPPCLRSS